MATTFIVADSKGSSVCNRCGAPIEWAEVSASGRRMPFDAPILALTTKHDAQWRLLEEVDLKQSHLATCSKR